jgi:hypothetical protein
LLLARGYEELGATDTAVEEYSRLVRYFPGAEAPCRYAMLLKEISKKTKQIPDKFLSIKG